MSKREKRSRSDNNNNTLVRGSTVRHSQSHGSLVRNQYHMASDAETLTREHKHLVKRTKSFWKFGKNNSDSEILEGMALWRHRDLVDVEEPKFENKKFKTKKSSEVKKRDRSNDSDRTINNKVADKPEPKVKTKKQTVNSKQRNESEKKIKDSLISRKKSVKENDYEHHYNEANTKTVDNQFYDDEDGLMLKAVNRRNILQQYDNDDSTEMESGDSDSDDTSDDPYDSILIEDQKVHKNSESNFPNVAEIGKKLEKLSKSSKYVPNKGTSQENTREISVSAKNKLNNSKHTLQDRRNINDFDNDIIQYPEKRYSFRTFRDETDKEKQDKTNKYFSNRQNHDERNNETQDQEKRRFYATSNSNRNNTSDRRTGGRPGYEKIKSDSGEHNNVDEDTRMSSSRRANETEKCERLKYYDSTNEESDIERQFLPRTKLSKTNSNGSKYESDLMGYGETLQRRLKNPEYGSKYDDKSPHNGNMYGPWYDLWGLDATARKSTNN
ncbi:hypothetical protein HHI36_018425 [Cryptolaemus montrouzieri]|uniref:Uncharacterized protein n=1 Tax=Cryptolaemus montrouzieri TaxID=559131 RepID=A0ABD2NZW4_9CUCU